MRVEPYDLEAGTRTDTVTGRLLLDGRRAAVVSVTRTTTAATSPPQPGTRVPARWRGDRPRRVRVDWSDEGMIAHVARLERDRRAAALGVDPATLTADPVPPGTRPRDAVVMWSHNGALLPDGTAPVFVDEADRIKRHGRPTEAVIAAIDFLAPLPGTTPSGASIANVALDVDAEDGGTYRVLARFGFRTPARRQQIGHPGARIPVRVDRRDHTRVVLDATRLPES
ncbi:hypothetical protein SAMN05443575_0889 [Jatrophihabitans endophyticus]|uniref:Uncharacterized protein n=1 Tax=Jatrophihabitans endophyticus TaxID=1206085 RepID=A0A1M5EGU7_9ACTN|nr:hypothetical protein [Jatrophihabitans endophyticus]SHF78417.1 hypothetical protein SAMN05443575_0889 [Jatrophihabitans endophyticus]